jgi:divalent metal cation (Fe/Co/Zn/Cd) transporter
MAEDTSKDLDEEVLQSIDAVEQHQAVSNVSLQAVRQDYYAEIVITYNPDLTTRDELTQPIQEQTEREVESFEVPQVPLHLLIHYEQSEQSEL